MFVASMWTRGYSKNFFCFLAQKIESTQCTFAALAFKYLRTCCLLCVLLFASLLPVGTVEWQKYSNKFQEAVSGETACSDKVCSLYEVRCYTCVLAYGYLVTTGGGGGGYGSEAVKSKLRAEKRTCLDTWHVQTINLTGLIPLSSKCSKTKH
jgi:hypothetical protein